MGSRRAKTKESKINKHERHMEKQKKLKSRLGIFLIIIMSFSIFGYVISSDSNSSNSNNSHDGFTFKSTDFGYNVTKTPEGKEGYIGTIFLFQIPEQRASFYLNNSQSSVISSLRSSNYLYVVSDPTIIDVKTEVKFNETSNESYISLGQGDNFNETLYEFRVQEDIKRDLLVTLGVEKVTVPGVSVNFPGLSDDLVINCANATASTPVIMIVKENTTSPGIRFNNNCIEIVASNFKDQAFLANSLKYDFMVANDE